MRWTQMNWLEVTRGTESSDRKAIWVVWDEARPHVWRDDLGVVRGDIAPLVEVLEADPNMPEWFKDCDEVIFPNIGIIFLGPTLATHDSHAAAQVL